VLTDLSVYDLIYHYPLGSGDAEEGTSYLAVFSSGIVGYVPISSDGQGRDDNPGEFLTT
jgi:hypothetical protein